MEEPLGLDVKLFTVRLTWAQAQILLRSALAEEEVRLN